MVNAVSSKRRAEISALQSIIAPQFDDLLVGDERVALLDFPDHDNIGDSAIYLGELEFLRQRQRTPSYVSTKDSFVGDDMSAAIGDGPILLHGGGNFGDLWPWFQPFREMLLERYKGRPIVQFPQTVLFESPANADRTARLIEAHGAFTLFVRDQPSYDFAVRSFQCEVRICPDMAYFMAPLARGQPSHDLLLHLRTDKEAAGQHDTRAVETIGSVTQADWPAEPADFRRTALHGDVISLGIAYARGGKARYLEARYRRLAERRIARGVELLSRGRNVITDRLHGHIMCYLMDIPHCVLDNSYGKIGSFMKAWRTTGGNVAQARDLDEAAAWHGSLSAEDQRPNIVQRDASATLPSPT